MKNWLKIERIPGPLASSYEKATRLAVDLYYAKVADEMFQCGVDVLTNGDHVWDQKEAVGVLNTDPRMLRPANYPDPCLGKGMTIITKENGVKVAVLNLMGRVFMT